jgi:hypothetical protein
MRKVARHITPTWQLVRQRGLIQMLLMLMVLVQVLVLVLVQVLVLLMAVLIFQAHRG